MTMRWLGEDGVCPSDKNCIYIRRSKSKLRLNIVLKKKGGQVIDAHVM